MLECTDGRSLYMTDSGMAFQMLGDE